VHCRTLVEIEGMLGQHPRIREGRYRLQLDDFGTRLQHFITDTLPAYQAYQELRRQLLQRERARLRLEEFQPRVLTSFVRNRLINEVYLPLIGDNLAKQIGAAGAGKRTDLMGMLLLISPPGYGKTTLMEYLASILGLVFMKINGPAIGHSVRSLDPAEAPNATARQELEKLGLALEMGNNVMLYLDDIQHCDPEFLQKFISLCDGQRRIEGVWRGRTRTYDLRGKKFAVVMAGNPYTESGEQFRIPDMLANRADTYNLGDILGGAREAFELSYLENCLTGNAVLAPLGNRSRSDFSALLRLAAGDEQARGELEHPYSAVELDEITSVLRHLRRIQQVLLQVNQAYIRSAATAEPDREEPPFKLQGSYRNMSKLAEKVVPVMTPEEVEQLILDHYVSESQTLTTNAESSLLKFKLLCGFADDTDRARWNSICAGLRRRRELGDDDADPMAKALLQLVTVNERLGVLGDSIDRAAANRPDLAAQLAPLLEQLRSPGEAKVEVVNTFPRYYGQLYEQHIRTIEHTLSPAMAAIGQQLNAIDEIKRPLRELVAILRQQSERQRQAERFGEDGTVASDAPNA
ncbi:MAG: AAA family ATPase, partial [Planctomycetota bacterium]